jgi:uncharacterized protein (DUF2141 family)
MASSKKPDTLTPGRARSTPSLEIRLRKGVHGGSSGEGRSGLLGTPGAAVLLAGVSVALALGVVASSAPAPGPSFAAPKNYATGPEPAVVVIRDLNGDGKADLATANGDAVSVRLNRGDGSFHARREYRTGGTALASGDLNGDGKLDLATAPVRKSHVSVLLNRGDGSFRAPRDYRAGPRPVAIAIGDLNGDRKLDLATANAYSAGTKAYAASVLLNRGDGSFRAPRDYRTGTSPEAIAIGDVNGDRKLDLVTANDSVPNTASVLLNTGRGRFRAKRDYRIGPAPTAVAIGDLNGDGRLDLVTTNLGYAGNTVSVLTNRGKGSFRAKRDYRTGGTNAVAIGDLNGDRKPDIATANGNNANTVSVLANKGDGSFAPKLDYRAAGGYKVAIGDLNGDGRLDLVTANWVDANSVSVLINTPGLCVVQDVRRMALPAATRMLARVNCQVGEVGSDYSEAFKSGLVMWQKPGPGAVRPDGEKVNLLVSRGRKQ